MSVTYSLDGKLVTVSDAEWAALNPPAPPEPPAPPQTVFPSRVLMQTLFTETEQQAIFQAAQTPAGWQIFKFITFLAATPQVDIADPEFVADIEATVAAGLLTAPRAAQILAGQAPS